MRWIHSDLWHFSNSMTERDIYKSVAKQRDFSNGFQHVRRDETTTIIVHNM